MATRLTATTPAAMKRPEVATMKNEMAFHLRVWIVRILACERLTKPPVGHDNER